MAGNTLYIHLRNTTETEVTVKKMTLSDQSESVSCEVKFITNLEYTSVIFFGTQKQIDDIEIKVNQAIFDGCHADQQGRAADELAANCEPPVLPDPAPIHDGHDTLAGPHIPWSDPL